VTIHTSAPGKLFLLGEYAVLGGAPALLAAVDRRAEVTIDDSASGSWQVSAPNLGIKDLALGGDGALPTGLAAAQRSDLRIFDAVREAVLSRSSGSPRPLAITIDSAAFSRGGHKLGLGSSAAVAGALTAALATATRLDLDREALFRLADDAHRSAQGGVGSGGDVAASVYGGLIRYSRGAVPVPLRWPEELSIMAVVTGEGSLTTSLVGRVADYAAEHPARHRADIARLADLAEHAEAALADPDAFLRLATDYFAAITLLDTHARAGIVTRRHHELHTLAKREGGVFKTSGAGGGDVGLAFSHSGEPTERLAAALADAGATVVPLGFFADGVQGGSTS
jgi:phosphomevalonate kinase